MSIMTVEMDNQRHSQSLCDRCNVCPIKSVFGKDHVNLMPLKECRHEVQGSGV